MDTECADRYNCGDLGSKRSPRLGIEAKRKLQEIGFSLILCDRWNRSAKHHPQHISSSDLRQAV